jgi:exonuclease III
MSRYPIGETWDVYRPFFSGGARVSLPDGRDLAVHTLWIHHLPDCTRVLEGENVTAQSIVDGESDTRHAEIKGILADMSTALAGDTPVLLAGDFNSPSHLDWTEATASQHQGLVVEWPVSRACVDVGLVDAYRHVHPDPVEHPGITWSPRFGMTDRIDYVYYKGAGFDAVEATVIAEHAVRFPSDHAAVAVRFRLEPRP